MKKADQVKLALETYGRGENVLKALRQNKGVNDDEAVLLSYELQSGSYTQLYEGVLRTYLNEYSEKVASVLAALPSFKSLLEVGVGEANLINKVCEKIDPKNKIDKFGFDISWSRIRFALQNTKLTSNSINLFVANLFEIPLPDNSIDVVISSHALESNGGREQEMLLEMYRVARQSVVLLEPDYKSASPEGKARMEEFGYVQNLKEHSLNLGFSVVEDHPFSQHARLHSNGLINPTRLTVIEKSSDHANVATLVCPATRSNLTRYKECLFSDKSCLIFPIINEIPILLSSTAIIGTQFGVFNNPV
jgi:ubiquinone/menaquinone biosynthesis C-methylase UbiE/uncharacterized protein YbaR (Trm112 family)